MSLDMLAEKTGVSKSMLGQIERGESNPTVNTIGKIVEGIRVPFEELIEDPPQLVTKIERKRLKALKNIDNQFKVYVYFPYDKKRGFEIYVIEIEPGGTYVTGSHGENTFEYVNVFAGELTLIVNKKTYIIPQGDAIQFPTDTEHVYRNSIEQILRMNVVLYWGNNFSHSEG